MEQMIKMLPNGMYVFVDAEDDDQEEEKPKQEEPKLQGKPK